jgi:hypothetical protein
MRGTSQQFVRLVPLRKWLDQMAHSVVVPVFLLAKQCAGMDHANGCLGAERVRSLIVFQSPSFRQACAILAHIELVGQGAYYGLL